MGFEPYVRPRCAGRLEVYSASLTLEVPDQLYSCVKVALQIRDGHECPTFRIRTTMEGKSFGVEPIQVRGCYAVRDTRLEASSAEERDTQFNSRRRSRQVFLGISRYR